ncbi:MAG: SH3 domain-containing protein [Lachnospiraceae bacterium]|nr:SH3 domain-containing protein [Lachnospiraceae bacterium]
MKKIAFIYLVAFLAIAATACTSTNNKTQNKTEKSTKVEAAKDQKEESKENTVTPPKVEEKPQYTYTENAQTMYTISNLNVRDLPVKEGNKVATIEMGEAVTVTAQCNETQWYAISYNNGKLGYVSNEFLSKTKPVIVQAVTPVPQPSNSSGKAYEPHDTGDAQLNAICDEILTPIIQKEMTERQKAYAVYTWVTGHVKYRGISDTSSWIKGAKTALSLPRNGNCFAFYCASRGLLTRLGFENVEASSYGKGHYWNMVKVDGNWWHFDTTSGWATERFLWTSKQINEYQYYDYSTNGENIVYNWNPEGCPQTP